MQRHLEVVIGAATATARLEVISAVPAIRRLHCRNRIWIANSAPPRNAVDRGQAGAGGAAQQDLPVLRRQCPSRRSAITEGRGDLTQWHLRGPARPGADHQNLQGRVEDSARRGSRLPLAMASDSGGTRVAPQQPPPQPGQRPADRRAEGAPDPAGAGHTVEQAAELVVVGEVLG